jgi:hypothetical protein
MSESKSILLRLVSLLASTSFITALVSPIRCDAYNLQSKPLSLPFQSRREWIHSVTTRGVPAVIGANILLDATGVSSPAAAVAADTSVTTPDSSANTNTNTMYKSKGLAERLSQRDASLLTNRLFNLPPAAQVYPEFMRGTWKITASFAGYQFPSKAITRQRVTADVAIAGFQKCSIAGIADIGKEQVPAYLFQIDPTTGLANVEANLKNTVDAYLGYKAVASVIYAGAAKNPNRIGIDFVDYKTINAERIELFCNARESELVTISPSPVQQVFVCSEYLRQVTFGTGSEVGVPRQAVTNYAHFWTWRPGPEDDSSKDKEAGAAYPSTIKGNLLTVAYLDPQDAMYFEEPSKPVAVYSHTLTGVRVT